MNKIYNTAFICALFCLFSISNCFAQQKVPNTPNQTTAKTAPALQEKAGRLAQLIHASEQQKAELEKAISYIQENWEGWTQDHVFVDTVSYFRTQISDNTYITVHPNIPEVCIFTKGHTKILGSGAFKRVEKGLAYVLESEVAVALSHELTEFDSFDYPDYPTDNSKPMDSSSYPDSSSSSGSSYDSSYDDWSSADPYNDYFYNSYFEGLEPSFDFRGMDEDEPKMLEKVQGLRGVIQIYFISYHKKADNGKVYPIIVGKYYNGGTVCELSSSVKEISPENKLLICHDLLLGLSEIHSRNIMHGDLHCGNILLHKHPATGEIQGAYLSDFGLSRMCNGDCEQKTWDRMGLATMLIGIIMNVEPEEMAKHGALAYMLYQSIESNWSSEDTYRQFVELLPGIVDEEAQQRIMANAKIKKALKTKYRNVTRWY